MSRPKVDWPRARRAEDGLDAIAKAHPELIGPPSEENRRNWEGTLMKEKQSVQYVVRLTSELASRVDAYAERLRVEQPGLSVSKSDVVRVLLTRALDAVGVSADAPSAKPKATKKK